MLMLVARVGARHGEKWFPVVGGGFLNGCTLTRCTPQSREPVAIAASMAGDRHQAHTLTARAGDVDQA